MDQVNPWLVAARAGHFIACLAIVGAAAFDRLIATPHKTSEEFRARWMALARKIFVVMVALALASGVAWFLLITADMIGDPFFQSITRKNLAMVWNDFPIWQWRTGFWIGVFVCVVLNHLVKTRIFHIVIMWAMIICSGFLTGSIAWLGHGLEGDPAWPHLTADVIHLLAAGCWAGSLFPMFWMLRVSEPEMAIVLARRFSNLGLVCVLLLAISGLVNAWYIIPTIGGVFDTTYGRTLLVKSGLFICMVALGAINRLRWVPKLESSLSRNRLRRSVGMELLLGIAVMAVVAVLGLLPPPD